MPKNCKQRRTALFLDSKPRAVVNPPRPKSDYEKFVTGRSLFWGAALLLVLISGIWYLWPAYVDSRLPEPPPDGSSSSLMATRGQFGDLFGGLNTLFTALGFLVLVTTMLLQQREAFAQEDARRKDEVVRHEEQFERNFFELLRLLETATSSVAVSLRSAFPLDAGPTTFIGIPAFAAIEKSFSKSIHHGVDSTLSTDDILSAFSETISRITSGVGPYYRTLYQLLRYIEQSSSTKSFRYASIVRDSLSTQQTTLLFVYCLTSQGASLKTLVEHFGMLHHMDPDKLTFLRSKFSETAFDDLNY